MVRTIEWRSIKFRVNYNGLRSRKEKKATVHYPRPSVQEYQLSKKRRYTIHGHLYENTKCLKSASTLSTAICTRIPTV